MKKRIVRHVDRALASGFFAVALVWGIAAFVVSVAPIDRGGGFRAFFPSGSSSSATSHSVLSVPSGELWQYDEPSKEAGSDAAADSCTNMIDDEGDIAFDADDPDCDTNYNICTNGIDDDGDGIADAVDLDCDTVWE